MKMLEKTVIELKLPAHINNTFLYLGARAKISNRITKSAIFSMMVDSTCTGKPALLYNSAAKSYTFAELRQIGEEIVQNAFATLTNESDVAFYQKMNSFQISEESANDELLRSLVLKILKSSLAGINLRETDIENIVSVILISEEDLREGLGGEDGKGSYVFLKEDEPYTYYKETRAILFRYRQLQRAEECYKELFFLFGKLLEQIESDMGYSRQTRSARNYYDTFDSNMAFFKEFSSAVQSSDLTGFLQLEELAELRRKYVKMYTESGEIESLRHCDNCDICVFDKRKCVDKWIKRHLIKLLKSLCFVDTFRAYAPSTFEEMLFSKEYPGTYVFIKI